MIRFLCLIGCLFGFSSVIALPLGQLLQGQSQVQSQPTQQQLNQAIKLKQQYIMYRAATTLSSQYFRSLTTGTGIWSLSYIKQSQAVIMIPLVLSSFLLLALIILWQKLQQRLVIQLNSTSLSISS